MRNLFTVLFFSFLFSALYCLPSSSFSFLAAKQTVSSPALIDTAGDGIPDDWKINGVPITLPNGTSGRWDLKGRGASPNHKDVFVWIAWMEQGQYTHKPRMNRSGLEAYALERVVKAFQNAPVANPDGTNGITLHLVYADAPVKHVNLLGTSDSNGVYDWTAFQKIKNASFPPALANLAKVFHYVLFAHQINVPDGNGGNCLSGISRDIPSFDFIVSLGCNEDDSDPNPRDQGNSEWQSGTFMHELGHNFGLRHGGVDDILYKPNYVSVMNYLFQFSGIFRDHTQGQFDYSQFDLSLDENHLLPQKGVSSDPNLQRYGSAHLCGSSVSPVAIVAMGDPVRWDCQELKPQSTEISYDVNQDNCVQLLHGQQDWSRIVLAGRGSPSRYNCPSAAGPMAGIEADARIAGLAPIVPVQNVRTTATVDGIEIEWDRIRLDSVRGYEVFRQRSGGPVSRLTQTRKDNFLDDSAQPGVQYSYSVGAVAVLPNVAVLRWLQEREANVNVVQRVVKDLGRARFGLAAQGPPEQTDLSFRTAQSTPVLAKRPLPR